MNEGQTGNERPGTTELAVSRGANGAQVAAVAAASLALGLVFGLVLQGSPDTDPVVVNNNGPDGATISRLDSVEKVQKVIAQQSGQLLQRIDGVAANHNRLVGATQTVERKGDNAIRLMEQAIIRIHGEAEWKAAVTYVQVKAVEDANARAEAIKAAKAPKAEVDSEEAFDPMKTAEETDADTNETEEVEAPVE